MQITSDIRRTTRPQITPVQKFLYSDYSNGHKLFMIAEKHNLGTSEKYELFATTVGDIILGFYKVEDAVPLLQQELAIDPRAAALLGADVLDFLAPLSDPQFVTPTETTATLLTMETNPNLLNHTATHIEPAVPVSEHTSPILAALSSNPIYAQSGMPNRPGALPNLYAAPELRTMAADMAETPHPHSTDSQVQNDTPIYSSQQPSVRTPLSELPTYHNPSAPPQQTPAVTPLEPPRWGA